MLLSKVLGYLILLFLLMIGCFFLDFIVLNCAFIISRVLYVDLLERLIDGMSFCDICLFLTSSPVVPYQSYKNFLALGFLEHTSNIYSIPNLHKSHKTFIRSLGRFLLI